MTPLVNTPNSRPPSAKTPSRMAAASGTAANGLLTSAVAQSVDANAKVALAELNANAKVAQLKKALAGKLIEFTGGFKKWDRDGSGAIDRHEFQETLQKLNIPHDEESCEAVFAEFDWDCSGAISYYECMRYILLDILQGSVSRVLSLFKLWDVDCSGTIDLEEFRHGLETMGIEAPKGAVDKLFDELDELDEGELEYEELGRRLRRPRGHVAKQLASSATATATTSATVTATSNGYDRQPDGRSTSPTGIDPRATPSHDSTAPLLARPSLLQFTDQTPRPSRLAILRSSSRPPSPTESELSSDDENADATGGRPQGATARQRAAMAPAQAPPTTPPAARRAAWTSNGASPRTVTPNSSNQGKQPLMSTATPTRDDAIASPRSSALSSPRPSNRSQLTPRSPRSYHTASPRPQVSAPTIRQTTAAWRVAPIWQEDHQLNFDAPQVH